MTEELNELFATPVGLKKVAVIAGYKLYSSDKLVKAFLSSMKKTSIIRPYYDKIEELVNEGKIIPVFMSKGIVSFISRRLFREDKNDPFGVYWLPHKRIYVFLETGMSRWGTAQNQEVASTTIHECMHLLEDDKNKFMRVFEPVLMKYYKTAFEDLFEIQDLSKRDVKSIIDFLYKLDQQEGSINTILSGYFRFLESKFKNQTTLDDFEFRKKLVDYTVLIKIALSAPPSVFDKNYRNYVHIIRPLYLAYEKAFGKKPNYVNVYQELFVPSEVASQFAELFPLSSTIKKAMSAL